MTYAENVRDVGKSTEAMALNEIVKDIMASSNKAIVSYADDRSRKYLKSLHINGIYRALLNLPIRRISTEAKNNLKDLKKKTQNAS